MRITKEPLSFIAAIAISLLISTGLVGCASTQDEKSEAVLIYHAPVGATMPEGVNQIKEGMSSEEVQNILRPIYRSPRRASGPAARRPYTWIDVFEYRIGEIPSQIRVVHTDSGAAEVFYGFDLRDELE